MNRGRLAKQLRMVASGMARKDLEEMYEMVNVGDTVELVERNEETAQLFGGEQKPVVAGEQQPVMTASIRRL